MKTILNLTYLIMACLLLSCEENSEAPLAVDFEAEAQEVAAGEAVTFKDLSTGNPATWNWTFEGGTPAASILSGPTVIYEQPGTYSVTLELSNKNGSEVLVKEDFITVGYNDIDPDFSADKLTVIENDPIAFTDLSSGIRETWSWEFISDTGVTLTSTEQHPVMSFAEFGVYTVKLTVSNPEYSNVVVKEDYITVLDASMVEANFSSEQKNTYTGAAVSFIDQSVGTATSWNWTFEGGTPATSTDQKPTVTYSTPGRYKVTLVAANDEKSSTTIKDDYVLVIPSWDLVAFYPLEGNSKDAGPNAINANNFGNITFTAEDRNAAMNSAAVFDGESALVVPDHPEFNFETTKFTVSLWLKTDKASKMMVWQESGGLGSRDNQAWLRMDTPSDKKLQFITEDGNGGAGLSVTEAQSSGGVADGQWHHVVVVRDGLWPKIYIDGVFITERKMPLEHDVSNEEDFKIGAQEGPIGNYKAFFTGVLDDVIVYSRALSPAEVADLYNM